MFLSLLFLINNILPKCLKPPSPSFKLLKLPKLALKHTLQQFDVIDLFFLYIQKPKLQIYLIDEIIHPVIADSLDIRNDGFSLKFHSNTKTLEYKMKFITVEKWKPSKLAVERRVKISAKCPVLSRFSFERDPMDPVTILCYHRDPVKCIPMATDYFFCSFSNCAGAPAIFMDLDEIPGYYLFFNNLLLTNLVWICLHGTVIPSDILDVIVEKAPYLKIVHLMSQVVGELGSDKLFKLSLHVSFANWITPTNLLSFEGHHLILLGTRLSNEDVIALVNQWVHSENTKMIVVELENERNLPFDKEVILESFETTPWDATVRMKEFRYAYEENSAEMLVDLSCELADDIQREDGLLATILVENNHFAFLVWHKRFGTQWTPPPQFNRN